jgi:hypothetical protein
MAEKSGKDVLIFMLVVWQLNKRMDDDVCMEENKCL